MLNALRRSVSCDDDTAICAGLIDPSNPNWREEVRSELLDDYLDVEFVSEDTSIDDDYDKELEEPSIKSLAEALRITDQLRHFAQFNRHHDLALAVGKANDVISSLQLRAPKRQTALMDYFKYLELNFFTYYTVDAKRPKKLVNDVLHFFCTLSTRRNTVHFNYVPSVLELELCMGWKCTWGFVTMNFGFIFIYVHFLKAFCYKESLKLCLLPFLSNLYCTSIKRPLFKVPRVAA